MKEPRAVEIIHEQSQDKDVFEVRGYWEHDLRGTFETRPDAISFCNKQKFVVCTRPVKKTV